MSRGALGGPRGAGAMPKGGLDSETVKRLFGYFKGYKLKLVFVFLAIVISTISSVASALFIRTLIDDYITPLIGVPDPDFSALVGALCGLAVLFVLGVASTFFYNRTMAEISQGIMKNIRDEMFSHMQTLPVGYYDSHGHGDIMSYYTNDADALRMMLSQSLPQVIQSLLTIAAVSVAMLSCSIWLSLFVGIYAFGMLKLVGKIAGVSGKYFMGSQRSIADMNGYIEEMINGQKVVKVFNHEKQAIAGFEKKNGDLNLNQSKANRYANILMPLMNGLGYVLYVLIAILGGYLAINNITNISILGVAPLTLGAISSFLQLSRSFCSPIGQVSQQINSVVMAIAGAKRIFELLDEKPEEDEGDVTLVNCTLKNGVLEESDERTESWAWKVPGESGTVLVPLKGAVRLDHVDFSYVPGKRILHDVTLYAEPGQKIALVGATGAGKTTITNLINRFYDIDSGTITYDGIDIKKIRKSDLRKSMGMVLQDVNLFTGTVMDNIRYGRPGATDEECVAAAQLADADPFIRMLPHGYDTVLDGNGNGISQGQKQLMSIARAAVADPPVMILDEATSSIDTRTESIVQSGMDALMYGRTVFVIAHRLSTIQNADVIMVIDKGEIIERGNHERLLEKKGKYYQLYTGAMELD